MFQMDALCADTLFNVFCGVAKYKEVIKSADGFGEISEGARVCKIRSYRIDQFTALHKSLNGCTELIKSDGIIPNFPLHHCMTKNCKSLKL